MAKRKKSKPQKATGVKVDKYPFDPENDEEHTTTKEELFVLRIRFEDIYKSLPSQFAYDKMLRRLRQSGIDSVDFARYTFSHAVEALQQSHVDALKKEVRAWPAIYDKLRESWTARFVRITKADILEYWHKREWAAIREIVDYEIPNDGNKQPWPFFEGDHQSYEPNKDLDHIFLAVGIKLDHLFATKSLVTDEMWSNIIEKTKECIDPVFHDSGVNIKYSFGPHFDNEPMVYETVGVLWGFCQEDLAGKGFSLATKDEGESPKQPVYDPYAGPHKIRYRAPVQRIVEQRAQAKIRREAEQQARRQAAADGKGKKSEPKKSTTLANFIIQECAVKKDDDTTAMAERLHTYNRRGKIALPRTVQKHKRGHAKLYFVWELRQRWEGYRRESPSLPPLKVGD